MKVERLASLLAVCSAFPALCSAACYQLFDAKNKLVLQSSRSPVDLSRPSMSAEVARVYRGHVLVVAAQEPCDEIEPPGEVVKLPAQPLDRGPVRLSGNPVPAKQRTIAPTKPVPMFRNCKEARAAGAAPIRAGEPGFGAHLDKDGDGVACEPSGWRK